MKKSTPILLLALLLSSCAFNPIFFYPDQAVTQQPTGTELFTLEYKTGKSVKCLFYRVEKPIASVYFLHGNAGNLNSWNPLMEDIRSAGFQVYIIDYPGFGDSDGKAHYKDVMHCAQLGFDDFIARPDVQGTKKILMGFSLGGNLAVKIGVDNQEKIDAMVLEGPFTSQKAIGADRTPRPMKFSAYMIVKNSVNAKKLIQQWEKPLLIVHSKDDVVCPYEMGETLFNNAKSVQKEFWPITGRHLGGIKQNPELYFQKVEALIGE